MLDNLDPWMRICFLITAIAAYILVLNWDVMSDYRKWLKNEPVKHTKEAWIRAALLVPSAVLFTLASNFDHLSIAAIVSVLMMAFVWWPVFDGWYNTKRNFHWLFPGSVDPDDAWIDTFMHGLTLPQRFLVKVAPACLFTGLYIYGLL